MLFTVFLAIHIGAGTLALASGTVALVSRKGVGLHRRAGTLFFIAMVANTLASFVLATIHPSAFLLAIGVFSLYLVFAGWRAIVSRGPKAQALDWAAALIMLAVGIFMIGRAGWEMFLGPIGANPALLVFGGIGGALAVEDLRSFAHVLPRGPERLSRHLTRMVAAMIATTTAFAVVNLHQLPQLVPWLGPTVIGVPLIVYWNIRVQRGAITAPVAPKLE